MINSVERQRLSYIPRPEVPSYALPLTKGGGFGCPLFTIMASNINNADHRMELCYWYRPGLTHSSPQI